LKSVQNYLNAQGLSAVSVAENNMYVQVQGTAANIQKAFNVQIHNYKWAG
jgi:subtilase family serine protease